MKTTVRWLVVAFSALMALALMMGGCPSPTLSTIEVTPAAVTIAAGHSQQYKATGKYSDSTTKDLTTEVAWSSSDAAVATIDASKGLAAAVANGAATISASLDDNGTKVTGKAALTVAETGKLMSIAVTPANPQLAKGTSQELVATGTYEKGATNDITSQVAWLSSDTKILTVVGGLMTAVEVGKVTVSASLEGVTGKTDVTVTPAVLMSIQVTSPDAWVAKGLPEQFTATGIFDDDTKQDLTKQVVWASSTPNVTIAAGGIATAAAEGPATVSATMMGITGSLDFWVTSAQLTTVVVTPFSPSIAKGTKIAFSATGILTDNTYKNLTPFVEWASSDKGVATISGVLMYQGVATAVDAGTTSISATYKGITGAATLTVTPATIAKLNLVPLNPILPKGTTKSFVAIATFSDGSAQDLTAFATWGSSDPTVAAVSNVGWSHGVATALAIGTTTITASVSGKSDSTTLTVSPATLDSIELTPAFASIAKGTSTGFNAIGVYSDHTTAYLTFQVTWSSSDPGVAVISNALGTTGVATGVGTGTATIKAAYGGVTGATTLTVTSATLKSITVTPPNPTIAKGTQIWLKATGVYSDQSTQDLTHWVAWTSSDASVAVSNAFETHGLCFGQVVGSSKVTATFFGGTSGATTVTVTPATLSALAIAPSAVSIAKGTTVWLKAMGTYSDGAIQELSGLASWSSSDPSVSVSNALFTQGLASGDGQGSATITASVGGKTATATVTVTAATLSSIALSPPNPTIAKGTAIRFTATATYSDSTTQDISAAATWSSSDETMVIVSNAAGANGLATAVAPGSSLITANFGGKSGSTILSVTSATLASIAVTPPNPSVAKNATRQFIATGTFTDSKTQDISLLVTWSSSDESKAIISNAFGSQGLATGVAAGTSTISAALGGKSGGTQLTVTP
jgi:uncharacterized protein YjdB